MEIQSLIFRHPRASRHRLCEPLIDHIGTLSATEIVPSTYPGSVFDYARDRLPDFRGTVFTAGGDGTLHEAVNGWAAAGFPGNIVFCPLPLGTGNDFLFSIDHMLCDPATYMTRPLTRTLAVDLGKVTYQGPAGTESRYFFVGATCGLSGQVTATRARLAAKLPGHASYLVALAVSFLGWKNREVRVVSPEGESSSATFINFNAANVKHYGGGMVSCPSADPTCGGIDTVSMNLSLWEALLALPENFKGRFERIPKIRVKRFSEPFRVECYPSAPVQADGEVLGATPMEIEVLAGKLPVLLPQF